MEAKRDNEVSDEKLIEYTDTMVCIYCYLFIDIQAISKCMASNCVITMQ